MFANARMYALNGPIAQAWRELLQWVIAQAGVDVALLDYPAPQPLPALWARDDMACAFMCGYPLALARPPLQVLAAPMPSPARYAGQPRYCSDLVVRNDAGINTLADAWGRRMAFTTTESMSGYQAPRRFLAAHAARRGGRLFSEVIGPLITPRAVIEALLTRQADIGPLDSYALDLLRLHEPTLVAPLKVIASTAFAPIPALVAAPGIASAVIERLRSALLAVQAAPELAATRAALLLHGFAPMGPTAYHANILAADEATALGYGRLG